MPQPSSSSSENVTRFCGPGELAHATAHRDKASLIKARQQKARPSRHLS
jgi:hypothetical protein